MTQKIIQIGNSAGIILPQSLRDQAGLKPGDNVTIQSKGNTIIISPTKKATGGVDAKFMKMTDEFINEHADVLEELAKR